MGESFTVSSVTEDGSVVFTNTEETIIVAPTGVEVRSLPNLLLMGMGCLLILLLLRRREGG